MPCARCCNGKASVVSAWRKTTESPQAVVESLFLAVKKYLFLSKEHQLWWFGGCRFRFIDVVGGFKFWSGWGRWLCTFQWHLGRTGRCKLDLITCHYPRTKGWGTWRSHPGFKQKSFGWWVCNHHKVWEVWDCIHLNLDGWDINRSGCIPSRIYCNCAVQSSKCTREMAIPTNNELPFSMTI